MPENSVRDESAIQRGYGDVEVNRIPTSYVRLRQSGDDRTDEVYIHRDELERVVEEMHEVMPGE